MNKFISAFVIATVVIMSFGCCEDAKAATEAKLSVNSVAQAGFDNLSAADQAKILQLVASGQSKESPMVETVDKWVNVGERIGKMMGGAAREVGMAANDFAKTDVGKMTGAMIVWNYMGKDMISVIVHLGGAVAIMFVGFTWIYILMRRGQTVTKTYDPTQKNWFGNAKLVKVDRTRLSSEQQTAYAGAAFVVIVLSTFVAVTF